MSPLRVGILGCGGIASRHAAAIAMIPDEMQLAACASRDAAGADAFARKFGATAYRDFDSLLRGAALELLIIAIPPFAHNGEVERAAGLGIHLLVEKPIALTLERATSMLNAAAEAKIVAACGFMYRFGGAVLHWEHAAAVGDTGRVGMFIGQFHSNALHSAWWREQRRSGGQVVEQLIHIVDLARHQLGMPQSVYARTANFFHAGIERYDSDDASALILGFEDGRIGVLNATNGAVPGKWDKHWQLVAEHMTAQFTGFNSGVFTHTAGEPRIEHIDTQTDVFLSQLKDVAAAIRERRAPRVPLSDGAQSLRIVLAAGQSARERREIRL